MGVPVLYMVPQELLARGVRAMAGKAVIWGVFPEEVSEVGYGARVLEGKQSEGRESVL